MDAKGTPSSLCSSLIIPDMIFFCACVIAEKPAKIKNKRMNFMEIIIQIYGRPVISHKQFGSFTDFMGKIHLEIQNPSSYFVLQSAFYERTKPTTRYTSGCERHPPDDGT